MKRRTTYRLLVQSEDKSRNIMEIALYGLVALSCLVSIWQFAEQPPMESVDHRFPQLADVQIAS